MARHPQYPSAKEVVFTLMTWGIILWTVNFICGLIVQNRYIALDPINEKTKAKSFGYYEPNQDKILLFPGMPPYRVHINPLGLRSTGHDQDLTLDQIDGKFRILTVGDSMTFGLYVDDEASYPYQLQQLINTDKKNAVVLNAATGATTITDHLYYLQTKGLQLKPHVVILNFCVNDLDELYKNGVPVYESIQKDAAFNLAKTIKLAKFMRVFRQAQMKYRFQRKLKRTTDEQVRNILRTQNPSLEASLQVAEYDTSPLMKDPASTEAQPSWNKYLEVLGQTIDELRSQNIEVLFFIYPDILSVYNRVKSRYEPILTEFLKHKEVAYIDLISIFQSRPESFRELYHYPPRDFHLSDLGNRVLAEAIYEKLKDKL